METIQIRTKPCFGCGETHFVEVLREDAERWAAGTYVQVAFPEMPAPIREMLVSGTCPECWERMWNDDDE